MAAETILDNAQNLETAVHTFLRHGSPACSPHVYKSLLKACNKRKSLPVANQIRAHLAFHNLHLTLTLGNYLVVTLATCGAVKDAHTVFDSLQRRSVYSWTALISAYTESGHFAKALHLHQLMKKDGVQPDHFTFASLFKACAGIPALQEGRKLHADVEIKGCANDVVVGNSLVSMYGKCGSLQDAEAIFCSHSNHVVASWNAMMGAYMDQGNDKKALQLFRQMCEAGVPPNQYTFASAVFACEFALEQNDNHVLEDSCARLSSCEIGQALHADARRFHLDTQAYVITALVNLYGKCGIIEDVENVFGKSCQHDVVSWSAVLYAYVEQGQAVNALHLFREMQIKGVEPDQYTFVIIFQACSVLAEQERGVLMEDQLVKVISLDIARALHDDAHQKGFISDIFVGNILVNVYGKCGSVKEAENVFARMPERDIVSFTAMLSAFVEQGQGHKAFQFYRQVQQEIEKVNDINLMCMLQGCVESGSIEICRELHFAIVSTEHDLDSRMISTLMSAYGSCACMVDTHVVLDDLSKPDVVAWSVCILGYAGDGDYITSLQMFEELQLSGVCPDEATFAAVIVSCSHAGLLVHGREYFESISAHCGVTPDLKHYSSLIDLLARSGAFEMIKHILEKMPISMDLNLCLSLLSACRVHGNVEMGKWAFEHAVKLQPKQTAAYTLMSNICSDL